MTGGSSMEKEFYDQLSELRDLFEYNKNWFNDWERGFVTDTISRFKEYGAKAYFSDVQEKKVILVLDKVRSIAVKSF